MPNPAPANSKRATFLRRSASTLGLWAVVAAALASRQALAYLGLVGVLTRGDLLTALAERGEAGIVGEVMKPQTETADPSEMLQHALARLDESQCPALPVVRNGTVVGILTPENVGEFVMIRKALRGARDVRPAAPADKPV